jgi:hypothetical protein
VGNHPLLEPPPSGAEGDGPSLGPPGRRADGSGPVDWATIYAETRRHLVEAFVGTYSRSLQQTLHAMGARVLEHRPEIAAIRLSLPNIHHIPVDLAPFGLTNEDEVFVVSDRPYGLIEGTVTRSAYASGPVEGSRAPMALEEGTLLPHSGWGWW